MKKTILFILVTSVLCSERLPGQSQSGATKFLITGHASVTAVLDSGQSNFGDVKFSAIFLYQLSSKLFVESELEFETGDGEVAIGLEHANLVWMVNKNIAFHAGRFVPHFGMYRGRLQEGFMSRFSTHPVGFGDGGIGTMEAVGFGFQGGFAAGSSKFNYDLWVSNGPELLTDGGDAGQFEYEAYIDNNKNKAIGGHVGFLPLSNSSLEVGLSYENTNKSGNQYSSYENVGVSALAFDINYFKNITAIKSTIRLNGEYKQQKVDKVDFAIEGDSAGATYSFDNNSNCFYGSFSLRPSLVSNQVLRNFEIAFRYSQFKTPDGAQWAYYNADGKNKIKTQTAVSLSYWLRWNCVAKIAYQMQSDVTNQVFVQIYYGF